MRMKIAIVFAVASHLIQIELLANPVDNSKFPPSTVVVFNTNSAASKSVAEYYAAHRRIPPSNLIGLACPVKETITRAEYEETIARPIKAKFAEKSWWKIGRTADGTMIATENNIRVIALIHGMPLRIAATQIPDPKSGKLKNPSMQETDAASVDSELAILGVPEANKPGMQANPYYRKDASIATAPLPMLMLVGRIDGPDEATAKRLVIDALNAEQSGLWGRAVIDIAQLDKTKGAGYREGDERLRNARKAFIAGGIPVVTDLRPETLVAHHPLGDDVVFYFGWYTQHANGPFQTGDFRFKKGAIASHLHSYSATSLKADGKWWVTPLLQRGAAATLGNVYEPFLSLTTNYDVLALRILEGYTFIEAAWNATPATSWMNVMIGDPLYQPFSNTRPLPKKGDPDFKALRIAANTWGKNGQEIELQQNLSRGAEQLQSGNMWEYLASHAWLNQNEEQAIAYFKKAEQSFPSAEDKLRQRLNIAEILVSKGRNQEASQLLQSSESEFSKIPEAQAATAWRKQISPPAP